MADGTAASQQRHDGLPPLHGLTVIDLTAELGTLACRFLAGLGQWEDAVVAAKDDRLAVRESTGHPPALQQCGQLGRGHDAVAGVSLGARLQAFAREAKRVVIPVVLCLEWATGLSQVMRARQEGHPLPRLALSQPEARAQCALRLRRPAAVPEREGDGRDIGQVTGEGVVATRPSWSLRNLAARVRVSTEIMWVSVGAGV